MKQIHRRNLLTIALAFNSGLGIGVAHEPQSVRWRIVAIGIPGVSAISAVGAFLGRSPDGTTKAVFSVVLADGSMVQEHTLEAVDGLAPIGTISPLLGREWDDKAKTRVSRHGSVCF